MDFIFILNKMIKNNEEIAKNEEKIYIDKKSESNYSEHNLNMKKEDVISEYVLKMNGEVEIFRYFKNKILGNGAFGKVYEVICEWSNKKYACKEIPIKTNHRHYELDDILREINILKSLNHPNILKYIHSFNDSKNIYILTELCENKTLRNLLKKRGTLTELEIQYYAIQMISALKYLNDENIYHRDLKLSNIFLTDNMKIKIGDFGSAIKFYNQYYKFKSFAGTIYYMAPEISCNYLRKTYLDIWSFGIILYVLSTGKYPFTSKSVKKNNKSIKRKYFRKPYKFRKITPEFCDLINKILIFEPKKRLTWTEILNHDFFKLGKSIPKFLPTTTLESPPPLEFIKQFIPNYELIGFFNNKTKFKIKNKDKEQIKYFDEKIEEEDKEEKNKECLLNNKAKVDPEYAFYFINHKLNQKFINNVEGNTGLKSPEIYIKEFMNEKNSFGLAYVLSNGNYGIYFNNKNKLIGDSKFKNFFYLELKDKEYIVEHCKIKDAKGAREVDLHLLKIYKDYFDKITKKKIPPLEGLYAEEVEEEEENKISFEPISDTIPVHINYYVGLSQSDIFGFSNGTLQYIFKDKTQIIISNILKSITYLDSEGEKWIYNLDNAFNNNRNDEMKKRLRYAYKAIEIRQNFNKSKNA